MKDIEVEKTYLSKVLSALKKYNLQMTTQLFDFRRKINDKYGYLYFKHINDQVLITRLSNETKLSKRVIYNSLIEQYIKYSLWQENFSQEINADISYFDVAINFNIMCCVIDNALDNDDKYLNKDKAMRLVNWENLEKYFLFKEEYIYEGDVIDYLMRKVILSLQKMFNENKTRYLYIFERIKSAIESEEYMSKLPMKEISDYNLLINKSIKFEESCFLLVAFNNEEDIHRINELSELIAHIYWLIDDICDLFEDYRKGNNNSILYLYQNRINMEFDWNYICNDIENHIKKLSDIFDKLKSNINEDLFLYLRLIVAEWSQPMNYRLKELIKL